MAGTIFIGSVLFPKIVKLSFHAQPIWNHYSSITVIVVGLIADEPIQVRFRLN